MTLTNRLHYTVAKVFALISQEWYRRWSRTKHQTLKQFAWPGGFIQPGSARAWQSSPSTAAAALRRATETSAGWGRTKSSSCSPVSESHKTVLVTDLGLLHSSKPVDIWCLHPWIKSIPTSYCLESPRLLQLLTPQSRTVTFYHKILTKNWNKVAQKYRMLIATTVNENPVEVRDREQISCVSDARIMSHITSKQASSFFVDFFRMINTMF